LVVAETHTTAKQDILSVSPTGETVPQNRGKHKLVESGELKVENGGKRSGVSQLIPHTS
jgi:hypothetical protein